MTQTQNRVLDEIARLFTNAAGAAQGVRQEVETLIRSQAERLVADLDLVAREDFEAVRDMARLAREENEALKLRIEALEAQLARKSRGSGSARTAEPADGANDGE
ncbi:MAG TPA: accessory factor UbiK family protein [Parvibaculum sp.]|uniref:accessory factor UbiK family protein n=1 Tax=Parvibaculum sp. TaxID=2024848 RepID=UPI002BCB99F2|nr:accessory factor UbiK family protein [Parvibaculum sp.]HMM14551.1 accessory factor UbiK family protein [Parvibaculum sp.]